MLQIWWPMPFQKLIRLDGNELKKLKPGRRMDRIIAENVLRLGWHRTKRAVRGQAMHYAFGG